MAAIPIVIALQFSFDANKASHGLKSLGGNLDILKDTQAAINSAFGVLSKNVQGLGYHAAFVEQFRDQFKELDAAIQHAAVKTLGKDAPQSIIDMMKAVETARITETFSKITDTMNLFGKQLKLDNYEMLDLNKSLIELRSKGAAGDQAINNLGKSLGKVSEFMDDVSPKELKRIHDLFKVFKDSEKDVKSVERLGNSLDKMVKKKESIDKLKGAFQNLFGIMPEGGALLATIASRVGAFSAVRDAMEAQNNAVLSMQQMALDGYKEETNAFGRYSKGINVYTDAIMDAGTASSSSLEKTSEQMRELAGLRVTRNIGDLKEYTKVALNMGYAFEMSAGQAAEFVKNLTVIGGLGVKDVQGAADALANVQAQLGLTAQEASEAATQVGFMVRRMRAFGGTIKDVKGLTQNVAQLGVTFSKAGLQASEANDLLNRMLDPSKIEDNVLLWKGLNMTVQDGMKAMMGDTRSMNNMNEKMIDLAKNLQKQYGQSPIALQQMAEAYGLNLEQVSALASMNKEDLKVQQDKANVEQQAAKARESMTSSLKQMGAQLNVLIAHFVMPLLNIITPIVSWIVGGLTKIMAWIDKWPGLLNSVGKVAKIVLGGIILFSLLGIVKQLPIVGKLIGGLGKSMTGIIPNAKKLVSGIGEFFKAFKAEDAKGVLGFFKKIGAGIMGVRTAPGAGAATSALSPQAGGAAQSVGRAPRSPLLDQLSQLSPQQLLAVGAAMLMIGMAVGVILLSLSVLMKTLKGMSDKEMLAGLGMLVVVMGGMVAMLAILGSVGTAAAPGLMAAGAAMLMIGLAVALVILSLALLITVISGLNDPIGTVAIAMGVFIVVMAALLVLMILMGAIFMPPSPLLAGLMGAAIAFFLIGAGAALAGLGVLMIVKAMILLGENADMVVKGFLALIQVIAAMAVATLGFAGAVYLLGGAMAGLLVGTLLMLPALGLMLLATKVFLFLGLATLLLSNNFYRMGLGLKMIAENTSAALSALDLLKAKFDELGNFGGDFARQASLIGAAVAKLSFLSPVIAIMTRILPPTAGGAAAGGAPGGPDTAKVASLIEESNQWLEKISSNTARTVTVLERMETRGGNRPAMPFAIAGVANKGA